MTDYICGKCCFKQKKDKRHRLEMYESINKVLINDTSLVILCVHCYKQITLVNGVITTRTPYAAYSFEDKQRALLEANQIMNENDPREFEKDDSLQLDFFELMRK